MQFIICSRFKELKQRIKGIYQENKHPKIEFSWFKWEGASKRIYSQSFKLWGMKRAKPWWKKREIIEAAST